MLKEMKDVVLQVLYPRVCPVCRRILVKREEDEENPFVCKYCRKKLVYSTEPKCFICGKPVKDESEEFCENCKKKKRYFDKGFSLFIHNDDARRIIYDLKYGNQKDNADFIGREMALMLGEKILELDVDAVIPVPLHKKREFERGFNQAQLITEKFIQNLNDIFGKSPTMDPDILIRKGKTERQKNLSSQERAENVKNKFRINLDAIYLCRKGSSDRRACSSGHLTLSGQRDYSRADRKGSSGRRADRWGTEWEAASPLLDWDETGKILTDENKKPLYKNYMTVLLVDDIFTSGATLNECARVLKEAGVETVYFLTVSIVA